MSHQNPITEIIIDTNTFDVFPYNPNVALNESDRVFHSQEELANSDLTINSLSDIIAHLLQADKRRLPSKAKGAERILKIVNDLYDEGFEEDDSEMTAPDEGEGEVSPNSEVATAEKETKTKRARTGVIVEPKDASEVTAAREGTKQQKLLDMLVEGVTEDDAIEALNCKRAEFRRKLSGASVKNHGYGVYFDGEIYTIILPEGMDAVLPPRSAK